MLAAVFAGTTAWLALGRAAPARPAPAPPAPAAATTHSPAALELAALRRCQSRLEIVQASLDRAEAIRRGERADAAGQLLDGGPCAGDDAARAELEARIDAEVEARVRELRERGSAAREDRRVAVRHMVEDFLHIDAAQSNDLMQYVCAVREQRADVIEDVRAAKLDLRAAAERQEAQRQEILADLQRLLGKDKYDQLRSVGGLGKLGDLFECG
jgi:hypothetical protein